jgi:hypothetical protein
VIKSLMNFELLIYFLLFYATCYNL